MTVPGGAPRRRRRGYGRWVAAAVLALPLVEIVVVIVVARAIGGLPTFFALLLLTVAGLVTLNRARRAALLTMGPHVVAGTPPPTVRGAVSRVRGADLALETVGGLLLVVPGFVTGVTGLLLVLPPTRALLRPLLGLTAARLVRSAAQRGRWRVVAGEAVDVRVVEVRDLDDPARADGPRQVLPGEVVEPDERPDR